MAEVRYAIWRRKPGFLPPGIVVSTMYTLYGDQPAEPEQWEFLGPSAEPNKLVARDVRNKGFCLREASAKDAELAKSLYKTPPERA